MAKNLSEWWELGRDVGIIRLGLESIITGRGAIVSAVVSLEQNSPLPISQMPSLVSDQLSVLKTTCEPG